MTMCELLVSARLLLPPLHDLLAAYSEAAVRVEALIVALTTDDVAAVRGAVARQTATAARIARTGREWEAARDDLAVVLRERGLLAPDEAPTVSSLLPVLAPDDADALRVARRDVLAAVLRLQALNRQAAVLLRNAQGVVQRVIRTASGDLSGYGPRGQYVGEGRGARGDGRSPVGGRWPREEADGTRAPGRQQLTVARRPSPLAHFERRA